MVATQDTEQCGIPVIDLRNSDQQIAKEIRAACITYGFFIGAVLFPLFGSLPLFFFQVCNVD